ncbi:hypothetical protein G7043_46125 [Lentzea sp. NEAU-D13]|uniref:Lipoprotein n=1 Tax=Lentzea alba TaxID=2714351 RepID=A0A7C9RYR2_9PSEU|nr:hypothetical protein [Lentzea alba]NGY66289.1 hypothetical protein [Lentzea alba]
MRRLVLPALLLAAVASCGRPEATEPGVPLTTAPPTTTTTTYIDPPDTTSYAPGYNNEDLQRAANALKPVVEGEFAKIYSSLAVRNNVPMLIIHRKPDARFEAEVRKIAPDVRIDFRDARYSYAELIEYQKKVIQDDFEYWKGRGVRLSSVGHHNDGSGLRVGVTNLPENFVKQLEERYPAMSFTVAEEEIRPLPAK